MTAGHLLPLLLPLLLLPCGCRDAQHEHFPSLPTVPMQIGNRTFTIEIAATEESRQRGLMHRKALPADRGMIFVFDREEPRAFWMKNVPFPLDIVFLDATGRVVDVKRLLPLDLRSTYAARPAQYAIEINAGAAVEAGVKIGDLITLPVEVKSLPASSQPGR